jgi:hypothetical protein|tara:strand:- start:905 stop:1426 length:522 start_codon:yes stop_codon:yes gene_type:complete
MAFNVKKRGRVTYYYGGDRPTLSALVTEDLGEGDLKIYFAGLTGGYSAQGVLNRDDLVRMQPIKEVEMVFRSWEKWLQEAKICESISQIDFLEVHAFGSQPKDINPMVEPIRFHEEQQRIYKEYSEAYSRFFAEQMTDTGVPSRFTVHVLDFPDKAASYEFYSVGLFQKSLHE